MWAITNHTPFAAERCWVRDIDGAEVWLVAVKGTYDIKPDGTTALAKDQVEVFLAPQYVESDKGIYLRYESDLVHTKLATDIIVFGQAHAPRGHTVTELDVGFKVGNIKKVLRVIGDRFWMSSPKGPKISRPVPFANMPITYERAFGGTDQKSSDPRRHDWEPRNPVGTGFAVEADHVIGQKLPNVEDPRSLISSWLDRPAPMGFGPVAGHWMPRVVLGGTYDETWEKERLPLLPLDFDERFHQSAPVDQQTSGFLKGGELVELRNLTPSGLLKFRLPRVILGFQTHFDGGDVQMHRPVLHTVALEPDVPRVMLVWHTQLECHHQVLKLMHTEIRVKQRIMLSEADEADLAVA